jgi:hypothetical protein
MSSHYSGSRRSDYATPYGTSALRRGRRNLPCPTCKEPNRLTLSDMAHGYQCDDCARREEGLGF